MLAYGGLGHCAIHSTDETVIDAFDRRMKAGRLIVNAPSSQGAIGDIYNAYLPSLTLGCGSYGGNSVSSNVGTMHLINVKTREIVKIICNGLNYHLKFTLKKIQFNI